MENNYKPKWEWVNKEPGSPGYYITELEDGLYFETSDPVSELYERQVDCPKRFLDIVRKKFWDLFD